jgi:hypothetical protein
VKRPEQHVTDDLGVTQLRGVFVPLGWTVSRVEPDYGVDFDVEVFRDNISTGVTFRVQLKSSSSTAYSGDGQFVSQVLTVPQARRITRELRTPVLLIHCDVTSKRTFWCVPQLDVTLVEKLTAAEDENDITVRIPTANSLPETVTALLDAVSRVENVLASRVIVDTPVPNFVESLKDQPLRREVLREFQAKAEALRIQEAHLYLLDENLEEASRYVAQVLGDANASVESKFSSILIREMVEERRLQRLDGGDEASHKAKIAVARDLQELTRRGPPHLKFFALIQRKAAELGHLVQRDWGLFLASRSPFSPVWLGFKRARVAREVNNKYRQCARLLRYAAGSRHRWALTYPTIRVSEALSPLIIRFRYEGQEDAANHVRQTAFEVCKLGASFAKEVNDQQALSLAAGMAAILATDDSSPENLWASRVAESLTDAHYRRSALETINTAARRRRGERDPHAKPATLRQIFENIATSLDPSDPTSH